MKRHLIGFDKNGMDGIQYHCVPARDTQSAINKLTKKFGVFTIVYACEMPSDMEGRIQRVEEDILDAKIRIAQAHAALRDARHALEESRRRLVAVKAAK